MSYLLKSSPSRKKTRQTQPIPGREKDMVRNNAGGFAFKADSFQRLERFLILGSEGGSYYVGEQDLTKQNTDNVRACLQADPIRTVDTIVDISSSFRAPKNEPALYALALATCVPGAKGRALDNLAKVARYGTDLFTWAAYIDSLRGWGPAIRKAVAQWYQNRSNESLGYQLAKYQQRNGWSHKDLLKLAHIPLNSSSAIRWCLGYPLGEKREVLRKTKDGERTDTYGAPVDKLPQVIQGMELAKEVTSDKAVAKLIVEYGLTMEMIPTEWHKSPKVWEALLIKMKPWAMVRSLGRMGACGLLAPLSETSKDIVNKLGDGEWLRASGLHPVKVLAALMTYGRGKGDKGSLAWPVVPQVADALDDAFYATFQYVQPTGKNFYLAVDCSSSMSSGNVAGLSGLTPCKGAGVMAMLIARIEPNYHIAGFTTQMTELKVTAKDKLDSAMRKCQLHNFGGTDTSVAIKHALSAKMIVDAFVVVSDGETWAGDTHTSQALETYRQKLGRPAKLVVINMVANRTGITDPADAGSLDVVGFDTSVPDVLRSFVGGAPVKQVIED